jgi:hypothetical protein
VIHLYPFAPLASGTVASNRIADIQQRVRRIDFAETRRGHAFVHTGALLARRGQACNSAVRSFRELAAESERRRVALKALPLSADHVLQRTDVESLIRHNVFETPILLFEFA